MGKNLMFKETYFTHTTPDGITYQARPMPEEFVGTHQPKSTGTPIRIFIYDQNEQKKFITPKGEEGVFLSDEGEQGYIGYYDYYIESDGSITSVSVYIHPFHRKKGIFKNLIAYLEDLAEEGTVSNFIVVSPSIINIVNKMISRKKGTVIYNN
jgi:GNAT superfamily N-acetyltransferase